MERFISIKEKTIDELDIHKHNIKYLDKVIELLSKNIEVNSNEVDKSILMAYIKIGSIARTKEEVNEVLGYRIKTESWIGERKYTNNDISELISSEYQEGKGEEYKEVLQVAKVVHWYLSESSYGVMKVLNSKINEDWIER